MRIERPDDMSTALQVFLPGDQPGEIIGIPVGLAVHVDDGSLPWDVHVEVGFDAEGRTGFRRVELVQRTLGPPITPSMIRGVRLGEILRSALREAAVRYHIEPIDGPITNVRTSGKPMTKSEHRKATTTPRRNAVTPETLAEAVRLYGFEKARPVPDPMQRVADQMGVSRATVGNYLARARKGQS